MTLLVVVCSCVWLVVCYGLIVVGRWSLFVVCRDVIRCLLIVFLLWRCDVVSCCLL